MALGVLATLGLYLVLCKKKAVTKLGKKKEVEKASKMNSSDVEGFFQTISLDSKIVFSKSI